MRVIDYIFDSLSNNSFVYDGRIKLSASELKEYVSFYSLKLDKLVDVERIAFKANNDVFTLILILAAMKSGKTFCPLYIGLSNEKVKIIALETGAVYINFSDDDEYGELFERKIDIGNDLSNCVSDFENSTFIEQKKRNNDVYIIYTSGTESRIKGCIIENESLFNYCQYISSLVHLSDKDISLVTTSLAFDLAYTSIFPVLFAGGSVCLFSRNSHIENCLVDYISDNSITIMKTTPSILRMISKSSKLEKLKSLRCIFSGGESFDFFSCRRIKNVLKECIFFNHYGPTEATIGCCIGVVDFDKNYESAIAVYPIENVSVSIKNNCGKDVSAQ